MQNFPLNKLFLFIIFLLFPNEIFTQVIDNNDFSNINSSQFDNSNSNEIDNDLIKIFIARTVIGQGIDTNLFKTHKIYSAMNLIGMLTNRYELVSDNAVFEATQNISQPYNSFDIAKAVEADRIFIIKVEQLKNILRTEIISVSPLNPDTVKTCDGFSLIHLFNKETEEPVYDPTLLHALQQAFALVENDSLLFEHFDVKPVPNIVISGVVFDNDSSFANWDIFSNQLLHSYEYSEIIFNEIGKSKDWIVFDIDSRDAIYGLHNMFLIENNIIPSPNELQALKNFNIFYYISAKIKRNKNGVNVSIYLHQLSENNDNIIKSYSEQLYKNDLNELKNIIKQLAHKIIEQ